MSEQSSGKWGERDVRRGLPGEVTSDLRNERECDNFEGGKQPFGQRKQLQGGRNQSDISSMVAGQVSTAPARGKIEAIIEKTVSICPVLLAGETWPLQLFCKKKSLDSRDHTTLSGGNIIF